jgi:hypothetical protein
MSSLIRTFFFIAPPLLAGTALADTLGSVEPIASDSVLDVGPLLEEDLDVRAAFAERWFRCGVVDDVENLLARESVTHTLDERTIRFEVAAGGFAGETNPTFSFRATDGASAADVQALADGLGFVMSQDGAFLLDEEDPAALDFPASYAVVELPRHPSLDEAAELFETVGRIDPELFDTDSSGYTQVGRSYVTLQSDVPEAELIAGYVEAARELELTYAPIVDGSPSLFRGSAAFPGNDWVAHPRGEEYLERLPRRIHDELRRLRRAHLVFTRKVLERLRREHAGRRELVRAINHLECRS